MTTLASRFISGVAVVGLTVVLVGCTENGTPRAGSNPQTPTETKSTSSEPTSNAPSDGLAEVDPCQLLTPESAAQAGLPATGKVDNTAGSKGCLWQATGSFSMNITLHADKGVKDLNFQGASPVSIAIGKHDASKVSGGIYSPGKDNGSCDVFIAVTGSSSVSVLVSNTGSKNTELACQRAEQVAKFIDPKLP